MKNSTAFFILLAIGIVVFGNVLFNGFVYDDGLQIVNNPFVHSPLNIPYFFMGGTFFDAGNNQIVGIFYRPILSTVFAFLYMFSGGYPFVFHLFQVILHCINAFLVFVLFRKFFKEKLALFLALIFLVHPINQEAVAYISDLQENLFFFFGMLTICIANSNLKKIKNIALINGVLLLGLLSKETAILFVPVLYLYSYLFHRKNKNSIFLISILFTSAFYLFLHFYIAHLAKITSAIAPIMKASLSERILTMPAIIFYYLKTFFFPDQLALGHAWVVTTFSFDRFYLPLIVDAVFFSFLCFVGVVFFKIKKNGFPIYLFFFSWFVLGIFMHLQFIPLDATAADRWFYFPMVGILGVFGAVLHFGRWKGRVKTEIVLAIGFVVVILLAGRTMVRNTNWINTLTLCQHDLKIIPDSYNVQSVCGSQLLQVGQYEEAKKHFEIAAKLAPKYSFNWYQYGLSYERTNNLAKAREYYYKSIQLSNEVNAYVSLAATYLKDENNPQEAKKIVQQGLKSYPNYQRLQLYLAVCEYRLNNKQHALEIAIKAYQITPSQEAQYVMTQILNNQEVKLD